ncbi:Pentatricopeptide repeat-containing protein [Vitis vinifera]|uniref:Pentatricopeptide repeat-containing protein n=1 Tax=Vitis vinifera TaxID=29760 RepID=A0A438CMQ9_VITVI|nr:Pentatricopeptide repeat-containing protein [Vitis vinifera]
MTTSFSSLCHAPDVLLIWLGTKGYNLGFSSSSLNYITNCGLHSKTLSERGTRSPDLESIPISESLVVQILGEIRLMSSGRAGAEFLDQVPLLMSSMKDDGVVVGQETFNSCLILLFERGREVSRFLNPMPGYNICIHAFGCWGDLGTALNLFKEMKDKSLNSSSFGPDLCTYNSLIRVLCLVGKVKDALIVWEELKGSGHEPDAFTYRILIQGNGRAAAGYTLFCDLKKKGIVEEMEARGFVVDLVTITSLLIGFHKQGRWDWTERLMKHIRCSADTGMDGSPGSEEDVAQHEDQWKLSLACKLFEIFSNMGVDPVIYTYNSMMTAFVKKAISMRHGAFFMKWERRSAHQT